MTIKYEIDVVTETKEITIETPVYYVNLDNDHSEYYGKITDNRIIHVSKHNLRDDIEYSLRAVNVTNTDLSLYDVYFRNDQYKCTEEMFNGKLEELKAFIDTI